jgi:putative transposase
MSLPREVLPGRVYMITRRCTQRQFLMKPDRTTNNAFIYCLAVAAERHGIDVLFTAAMSNHHHTGIHDRHGNYPAFLAYFHRLFAKCQNALRGRWENFWSSEQTSVVRLVDAEDVLAKMTYALTNPVKDGLVERAHHWPGVTSLPCVLHEKHLAARRPDHFFRDEGPMPESICLRMSRPPGFETMSSTEFRSAVLEQIAAVERNADTERRRAGRAVIGRRGVLKQRPTDRPMTKERRQELSPRIAAESRPSSGTENFEMRTWPPEQRSSQVFGMLSFRPVRTGYAASPQSTAPS